MTVVLAIDPGFEQSAWLVYNGATAGIRSFAIMPNAELLERLRAGVSSEVGVVVIEQIASYGMAVGREVFETVFWSGRFAEAVHPRPVVQLPRLRVKQAICHDSRAKDANIRAALLDRFGGAGAQGTKAHPGPLYGISKDLWSALAIAVTYVELEAES
jgi:hypothetical protein